MNALKAILLTTLLSGSPDPGVHVQVWNATRLDVQANLLTPSVGVTLSVTF